MDRQRRKVAIAFLSLSLLAAIPASAQGVFKVEKGEALNKIIPRDFVLEENSIPTEKRNSTLVRTPSGARLVAGLLDTSGYSSQVQEKYLGAMQQRGSQFYTFRHTQDLVGFLSSIVSIEDTVSRKKAILTAIKKHQCSRSSARRYSG